LAPEYFEQALSIRGTGVESLMADPPAQNIPLGELMKRFVEEADRGQWTLLPECLDDFIDESNPVRLIIVVISSRSRHRAPCGMHSKTAYFRSPTARRPVLT
jgi:hypothetical protein